MAPNVTSAGSSSRIETAAAMCSPAGRRKSPKVAVIVLTRHQQMDPATSRGGFLTRSAITRRERAVSGMSQALVEQRTKRGQGISDRVDVGARGGQAGDQ